MLILFDIDGTLLHTHQVSRDIFCQALFETFHVPVKWENYPYAGQPDRQVARDFLQQQGIEADEARLADAFQRMGALWANHPPGEKVVVYPGVREIVRRLANQPHFFLGQLTANARPSAVGKLRVGRFDPAVFPTGGYGDDADERHALLPIAIERCQTAYQRAFHADQTVIIGDSPADIECARRGGAKSIAVATGRYTADQLAAHQPDLLLSNFAEDQARWTRYFSLNQFI